MTTGFSTAKDPNMVKKFDVTIVKIEQQDIYNALGVSLVGPFASVEHKGQKITFIEAGNPKQHSIIQPISDRYVLQIGQKSAYIVDRGQVWIQPIDYPLPPEFNVAPVPAAPSVSPLVTSPVTIHTATPSVADKPLAQSSPSEEKILSTVDRLMKLKDMKDKGVITEKEYASKKAEILNKF